MMFEDFSRDGSSDWGAGWDGFTGVLCHCHLGSSVLPVASPRH